MSTELSYFLVSGNWYDVENPDPSGTSNQTLLQIVTGVVTFYPRVPPGFVAYIANLDLQTDPASSANTALAIAPIQARILSGQLQCINVADTPNINLLANTTPISTQLATIDLLWPGWLEQNNVTAGELIYDVNFTHVVYGEAAQALTPFGFVAPTTSTPINLTDNNLTRLGYGGPGSTTPTGYDPSHHRP